jgi:hypothetical protein
VPARLAHVGMSTAPLLLHSCVAAPVCAAQGSKVARCTAACGRVAVGLQLWHRMGKQDGPRRPSRRVGMGGRAPLRCSHAPATPPGPKGRGHAVGRNTAGKGRRDGRHRQKGGGLAPAASPPGKGGEATTGLEVDWEGER